MRILLQHRSTYQYPEPAWLGAHSVRLRPTFTSENVETYSLNIEQPCRVRWHQDVYGNQVARVDFSEPVTSFDVLVEMVVDIQPKNPFDFMEDKRVAEVPFEYPAGAAEEVGPFLSVDHPSLAQGKLYREFADSLPKSGKTVDLLVELNNAVNEKLAYIIREEPGIWTPEEVLEQGKGSCRDMATLLLTVLRERGLAARFVSGYLIQLTDEGMLPEEPKGVLCDVGDLHAWVEVYLPGAGWIGLDATSGLMCGEGHIALFSTATPTAAAPIDGTTSVLAEDVSFGIELTRLGHEPRPTAPYEDDVWEHTRGVAKLADEKLLAAGIRLTSGGEPTFNSRLHPDLPEWNGGAIGQTKWAQGRELTAGLRRRLAPGAATLYRQGKLYPGESLPRWALELIALRGEPDASREGVRGDGPAIWPDREGLEVQTSINAAREFVERLAQRMQVEDGVMVAYEDPWRLLQTEESLPVDVDPFEADLGDDEDRRRLARVLSRGMKTPAGFALPIARGTSGWLTSRLELRRDRLYLVPGDSPMGLRLPLGSIATRHQWTPTVDEQKPKTPDPRLHNDEDEDAEHEPTLEEQRAATMAAYAADPSNMRTVLCVEPRGDTLYVFLPPLANLDHFLELLEAIDATRVATGLDVMLEGYPPPSDPRLYRFAVTPDPGVLEVNIPVVHSSAEYEELIEEVFEAALEVGLHSEKYLLDGRQAGSGGGNHLTMGGARPLESPFVTRGDLLASLITFIQHHPSLSYLFNGLFVGPTSQSPRVDEARHDSLYELEIALARGFGGEGVESKGWPAWQNDQLYRHLLTDLTGNTHRAELCIDKLYGPTSWSTRQGVVELRAFEMPPHPRMVAAQMFLARSLVASFAEEPYQAPLVRWGARLHDQFLLPFWLWRDLEDVLDHLAQRGIDYHPDAYRPFLELRCPIIGRFEAKGVVVELRNAIEPWNVLGEELTGSGTARYVDSSMERIEIRVEGFVSERHQISVNGHVLPLHPTGTAGEYVAGVRFRAWAPPHSLHGHLGIHHPIQVDLYDRWARRSLGAAAYHVWHPEGRAFDAPPLTRFEAGARRAQRFEEASPLPFATTLERAEAHPDAPFTLDLRRFAVDRPMPKPPKEEDLDRPREFVQVAW